MKTNFLTFAHPIRRTTKKILPLVAACVLLTGTAGCDRFERQQKYIAKSQELNERDSILSAREKALNVRDSLLTVREKELGLLNKDIISEDQTAAEETNMAQSGAQSVNKVLNTDKVGNLSLDALVEILNNESFPELHVRCNKGKLQSKCNIGWRELPCNWKNAIKTELQANESFGLKHHGIDFHPDTLRIGRSADGLYWAENISRYKNRQRLNVYTEDGTIVQDGQQKFDLYRTNILATLQNIKNIGQ